MKGFLSLLFITVFISCSQSNENTQAQVASDSTLIGQWEPPSQVQQLTSEISLYKKGGRVFIYELFNDKSLMNEELSVDTVENGVKLNYKSGKIAGEYMILYKDNTIGWFSEDGREFARTSPK